MGKATFRLEAIEDNLFFASSSFWLLLVFLDVPWPVAIQYQSLPPWLHRLFFPVFSPLLSILTICFSLIKTLIMSLLIRQLETFCSLLGYLYFNPQAKSRSVTFSVLFPCPCWFIATDILLANIFWSLHPKFLQYTFSQMPEYITRLCCLELLTCSLSFFTSSFPSFSVFNMSLSCWHSASVYLSALEPASDTMRTRIPTNLWEMWLSKKVKLPSSTTVREFWWWKKQGFCAPFWFLTWLR